MSQQQKQTSVEEELKQLKSDLEMYKNDYAEYSRDKSVPLKDKAPILAEFAKLISVTQQRINTLEERLIKKDKKAAVSKEKIAEKERELEKKQIEVKKLPEQAPPPEDIKENLPVATSRSVISKESGNDKVILVIKVDTSKIKYFGTSGEINWRIVFDRFPGIATMEFNRIFAGSGLKFPIQIQTCMKVIYYRERNGQVEDIIKSFRISDISDPKNIVNNSEEFKKVAINHIKILRDQMFNFSEGGSDWKIESFSMYHIRLWEYQPAMINELSKPTGYVPTPEWLKDRRAIINIKNKDDQCFIKCLYRAIFNDDKNRHNDRDVTEEQLNEFKEKFNCSAILGDILDITKFESDNPSIAIDIYYLPNVLGESEDEKVQIMYKSSNVDAEHHVVLGYLKDPDDEDNAHYVIIKKLPLVFCEKYEKGHQERICIWCHGKFRVNNKNFEKHIMKCEHRIMYKPSDFWSRITIPKTRGLLKFNTRNSVKAKFVIYSDFEATTCKDGKQRVNSYCLFCPDLYDIGSSNGMKIYCSGDEEDVMSKFCTDLYHMYQSAFDYLEQYKEVPELTPEQQKKHNEAKECARCGKQFTNSNPKCRHHDHTTGEYIGPYCRNCNLQIKYDHFKVRVVFHNLKGYDGHFIIRLALKSIKAPASKQFIIGSSNEQLSYIVYGRYIFMDSAQHLKESLDRLVSMTPKSEFKYFEKLNLNKILLRKGVYPYEYVDDFNKLFEKNLPPKECFKSALKGDDISDEDYKHAHNVWNALKCETLLDYHKAYLTSDVVLLADVMESYRKISIETWGLDPINFPSAPSLSWNNFVYYYKPKIELFCQDDEQILKMVVNNMRGGICSRGELTFANVYGKKNEYIAYLDMNNLYGKAMMMKLPVGEYQLILPKCTDPNRFTEKILNYNFENSTYGYLLEADIDPPDNKEWFNGYPLFPEKVDGKLECTLFPKRNYLVHIAYLQLGLRLGYKLVKVHRLIKFRHEKVLEQYIKANTEYRKKAPNSFYENYYKLLNNSIYGKTCENPLRYRNRKILTTKKDIIKFLNSERAYDFHIINDETLLAEVKKRTIYKKPIMIGFTVLELSKMLMADFYYNVMKKHYGKNCKLLYTDTDSLVCHIVSNKDLSNEFRTNPALKDRFEQPETAKVPGLMKVECFCYFFGAFSPKNYIYVKTDMNSNIGYSVNIKKKGVPKHLLPKAKVDDIQKLEIEFIEKLGEIERIKMEAKNAKQHATMEQYEFIKLGSKNHDISINVVSKGLTNIDTKRVAVDLQHTNAKGYMPNGK
jgi:hypothetical protein